MREQVQYPFIRSYAFLRAVQWLADVMFEVADRLDAWACNHGPRLGRKRSEWSD